MITPTTQAMTFRLTGLARTGEAGWRGDGVAAGPAGILRFHRHGPLRPAQLTKPDGLDPAITAVAAGLFMISVAQPGRPR
jgi:hypothetical protein